MRYLILLATAASIAPIKASPIDDLRKQLNKVDNDLQTQVNKNKELEKKLEQLDDQLQANNQDGLRKQVNDLEAASTVVLSVMPYLTKAVGELTITLNQQEFTQLISLIPLQSISPNITVNGATYTVELTNILNALTLKILSILS